MIQARHWHRLYIDDQFTDANELLKRRSIHSFEILHFRLLVLPPAMPPMLVGGDVTTDNCTTTLH